VNAEQPHRPKESHRLRDVLQERIQGDFVIDAQALIRENQSKDE